MSEFDLGHAMDNSTAGPVTGIDLSDVKNLKLPDLRYHDEYRRGYAAALTDVAALARATPQHPEAPANGSLAVPRELLARCLSSMKAAVTFGETRQGRPPSQTCLFEIEDLEAILAGTATPQHSVTEQSETFQQRVEPWMSTCFGPVISADTSERNHRFFEEATELVQAGGMSKADALMLVDYVYGRPVGELGQEIGGVMVTLAALCLANKVDMHKEAEIELARIWTKVEQIRAKQASKPRDSALPIAQPLASTAATQPEQAAGPVIDLGYLALKALRDTYVKAFGPLPSEIIANDIDWHIQEIIKEAALAIQPAQAATALRKLCDQLNGMRHTMFNMPGTGQNYSYLLREDVYAYVEAARAALAIPASTAPAAAVRAAERINAMHKGVVGVFAAIKAEHGASTTASEAERTVINYGTPAASEQQAGADERALGICCYGGPPKPKSACASCAAWQPIAGQAALTHRATTAPGYKLVPVEPTQAMHTAGFSKMLEVGKREIGQIYTAILAAAPGIATTEADQQGDTLPKWIDDLKGSDPTIDGLIEYIIAQQADAARAINATHKCSKCNILFGGPICPWCSQHGAAQAQAGDDAVVEANRQLLLDRSRVGIGKYGTTLAAAGLSRSQIAQHALEEALDLANYLQTIIQSEGAAMAAPATSGGGNG